MLREDAGDEVRITIFTFIVSERCKMHEIFPTEAQIKSNPMLDDTILRKYFANFRRDSFFLEIIFILKKRIYKF